MNDPFFSIVIVNYNHGKYIETAIASVVEQSCQDFELIVVDGASTDNSVEIVKKYENRIAWWCSEKDHGQSHAFNKGFAQARGRFFSWLNADDMLMPRTLERARAKLQKNPEIRWMTGNFFRFLNDGTVYQCKWGPHYLPGFLQGIRAPVVVFGPTSFFDSDLFREVGGMDEMLHYQMDTDLWIRFMAKGERQIRLNHYCWGFRMHEESKTSQFGNHVHNTEKKFVTSRERIRIRSKNRYEPSKALYYLALCCRILDGSLFIYLWKQFYWRGRRWKELIG